jgi:hypothetical protein
MFFRWVVQERTAIFSMISSEFLYFTLFRTAKWNGNFATEVFEDIEMTDGSMETYCFLYFSVLLLDFLNFEPFLSRIS